MKDNIKLALFFVVILGRLLSFLCTESSRWHSASIAMIFTMSGVFGRATYSEQEKTRKV